MTFTLHSRLEADTHFAADWPLCRVLVMNDARYPWLVLVPRRDGAMEVTQLEPADRATLMDEVTRAGYCLQALPEVAKLNIGALGNKVPQLHVHVVGRRQGDPAWPEPVWGHSPAIPYEADPLARMIGLVRAG